jgi:hypothetical protein
VPYHVIITPRDLRRRLDDVVLLDKPKSWIEAHIAEPRRRGDSIFVNGQTLAWAFIDEIHIFWTDRTADQILSEIRTGLGGRDIAASQRYVSQVGRDVTDEFLSGAPGVSPRDDSENHASNATSERFASTPDGVTPGKPEPSTEIKSAGDPKGEAAKILDFLSTPRSSAVIGISSLAISVGALITSAAVLAILGAITAIGFLIFEVLSRRRLAVLIPGAVLVLLASFIVTRYYTNPGITTFSYSDTLLSPSSSDSPFASLSSVPLTADPSTGAIFTTIPEGDGGFTSLPVSCVQSGYFNRSSVVWGKIVGGSYESLWIPLAYLGGIQPGSARTLLWCSDWRWILQDG